MSEKVIQSHVEMKSDIVKVVQQLNELVKVATQNGLTVSLRVDDNDDCTALAVIAKFSVKI